LEINQRISLSIGGKEDSLLTMDPEVSVPRLARASPTEEATPEPELEPDGSFINRISMLDYSYRVLAYLIGIVGSRSLASSAAPSITTSAVCRSIICPLTEIGLSQNDGRCFLELCSDGSVFRRHRANLHIRKSQLLSLCCSRFTRPTRAKLPAVVFM
jgi:hypothetical protein